MDFDRLYRLYFKDIYHYLISLTHDPVVAEEITQETFYKAIRAKNGFDGKTDIRAWFFTIAKNTYLSHLKKEGRIDREPAFEEHSDDVNFVSRLVDEEQSLLIHRFLHEMSEPYKEVFNLRVFGELSFENIGLIFGKSAVWARVTYHRARRQIIEYMEEMNNGKDHL